MPFIRADKLPDSTGRTARNASFKADALTDWVAEVDDVMAGEDEIDSTTFLATATANLAYNEALLIPDAPAPAPTPVEVLVQHVAAMDTSAVSDPAAKALFEQLKVAVQGLA